MSHAKSIYLDDAGHPVDKPFLVIGGCIASVDRWVDFEKSWRKVISDRHIDYPFHATDFFSKHYRDPKLKHITADLIRTISNYVEAAFSVGLDVAAYKTINQVKMLEECSGSPIAMISRVLRKNVNTYRKAISDTTPLLYFIEKGTYQYGDLADCWKLLDKVNPPIPVAKSHESAQVADLYAYSVFQSAPFIEPSWQHEMFQDTFKQKGIFHMDGRIMESDMRNFLARKTAVLNGVRVPIPDRAIAGGIPFSFEGNKNKQQSIRRAKIGITK